MRQINLTFSGGLISAMNMNKMNSNNNLRYSLYQNGQIMVFPEQFKNQAEGTTRSAAAFRQQDGNYRQKKKSCCNFLCFFTSLIGLTLVLICYYLYDRMLFLERQITINACSNNNNYRTGQLIYNYRNPHQRPDHNNEVQFLFRPGPTTYDNHNKTHDYN